MVTSSTKNRGPSEIVFFDLETTVPAKRGQRFCVLEFGAVVVCPRNLVELDSYCTLIKPRDLSAVATTSGRSDGITRDTIGRAPTFEEVADKIFSILDGRIWAGHNIKRFDCVRIKEAFAEINRPAPIPHGIIDSLGLLTQKFGRRAGDMKVSFEFAKAYARDIKKANVYMTNLECVALLLFPCLVQMATLAAYFGLDQQKHRSLEDVRLNLEVLKHCATVLLLESSLPPSLVNQQWYNNLSVATRSKTSLGSSNVGCSTSSMNVQGKSLNRKSPPSTSAAHQRPIPYARETALGKMAGRVKDLMSSANAKPLNSLLKHSQSLIR